jgi:hypothetical protein
MRRSCSTACCIPRRRRRCCWSRLRALLAPGSRLPGQPSRRVQRVAHQRVAQARHVDPDLVRPPRGDLHLQASPGRWQQARQLHAWPSAECRASRLGGWSSLHTGAAHMAHRGLRCRCAASPLQSCWPLRRTSAIVCALAASLCSTLCRLAAGRGGEQALRQAW